GRCRARSARRRGTASAAKPPPSRRFAAIHLPPLAAQVGEESLRVSASPRESSHSPFTYSAYCADVISFASSAAFTPFILKNHPSPSGSALTLAGSPASAG